jgi:hypothetical protein
LCSTTLVRFIPAFAGGPCRRRVRLVAFNGGNCFTVGGFPSNPIPAEQNPNLTLVLISLKRKMILFLFSRKCEVSHNLRKFRFRKNFCEYLTNILISRNHLFRIFSQTILAKMLKLIFLNFSAECEKENLVSTLVLTRNVFILN